MNIERGRTDRKETVRKADRVPLDGQRLRLALNERNLDPAFKYKWINDEKDKLRIYKDAGFVHVYESEKIAVGQRSIDNAENPDSVVSRYVGMGVTAYLMKQPIEFAKEDAALRAANIDRLEADMKRSLNSGKDGQYGNVEIKS